MITLQKRLISFILAAVFVLMFQTSSLAGLAPSGGKFLGNILKEPIETDNQFSTYWNQATTENSGKWWNTEPNRDTFTWTALDNDYNYTNDQGYAFKQHVFLWGDSMPSWVANLPAADIRAELEEWIAAYFTRYPNTKYVDVVNEALHAPPPQSVRNALGGDTNWAWIKWTFEKAKQYKPANCKLLINEYDTLVNSTIRSNYKTIISMLKSYNLIDGIGEQAHFLENTSANTIKLALDDLGTLGLPIYISEYDVNNNDDNSQRDIYINQFPVMWEHSSVQGVTLWGYKQNQMWQTNAYLLRSDGTERPALKWLRAYCNRVKLTGSTTFNTSSSGWSNIGYIHDNNVSTLATNTFGTEQYIQYNFGSDKMITSLKILEDNNGTGQISDWKVQEWSTSLNNWRDVFGWTSSNSVSWQTRNVGFSTDKIRLCVKNTASGGNISVMEFEAWGN